MPFRVLVFNPNTSAAMTASIQTSAQQVVEAMPNVSIEVQCADRGVSSVEGAFNDMVSTYWTLDKALREYTKKPVMGILEASVAHALPLGHSFSILTDSRHWQPWLEEAVHALGCTDRLASVRHAGITALDTVTLTPEHVAQRLIDIGRQAIEQDHAEVLCLGCAGMANLQSVIAAELGVPVIDGVRAAIVQVAGLLFTGMSTSSIGKYTSLPPRSHECHVPEKGISFAYASTPEP